jgi:hypothetical protein
MEQKIKELEQRRLRIGKAMSETSSKIKKLDYFVQHLAGATLVPPFIIPYRAEQQVADHNMIDELVVKRSKGVNGDLKGTYVYIREAKFDFELEEKKLHESPVDIRLRVEPHLEAYAEYLVEELEKKFHIKPEDAYPKQITRQCHTPNENDHICGDATDCRYGQPDGPDDYINECECYFEEIE